MNKISGIINTQSIDGANIKLSNKINGTLDAPAALEGTLSVKNKISGDLATTQQVIGNITMPVAEAIEIYHGAKSIVPSVQKKIVLNTRNLKLTDNITIQKVFYAEVSNESGGYTVTIGDVDNG